MSFNTDEVDFIGPGHDRDWADVAEEMNIGRGLATTMSSDSDEVEDVAQNEVAFEARPRNIGGNMRGNPVPDEGVPPYLWSRGFSHG